MTVNDSTNAARQARLRRARALGYESIPAGYLPPKRAEKVRQWLAEAERDEGPRQAAAKREARRKD